MKKKKYIILSVFGGGIKGILPATVIQAIEEREASKLQDSNFRIAEGVDFFAGTSTGGILVLGLNCPDEKGKARYKAKDLVDLYKQNGAKIFYRSLEHVIHSFLGLVHSKYTSQNIEEILLQYFKDATLTEAVKPVLIPAHDISNNSLFFFTSADVKNHKNNFLLRDVARATSAAPTYFPPVKITSLPESGKNPQDYVFIDGGVFANNPVLCAYVEAMKLQPDLKPEDFLIVSFGTGRTDDKISYDKIKNYGALEWLPKLISILFNDAVDIPDYQLKQLYQSYSHPECYIQIDCKVDPKRNEIDNASKENIDYLIGLGNQMVQDNETQIELIANAIVANLK